MKSIIFKVSPFRIALTKVLASLNRSIYYSGISPLCYAEVDDPILPGDDWVKVKTHMCGVCGSDLHLIALAVNPRISLAALPKHMPKKKHSHKFLGHEVVGEVIETGSKAGDFSAGDTVVLHTGFHCASIGLSPCCHCRQGNYLICQNKSEASIPDNMGGGWSEYFIAHKSQLFKKPDGLSNAEAAILEPTACSLHAVFRCCPTESEKVLVIGGGAIGLNVIQSIRALGFSCSITACVKYPFQAEFAKSKGADETLYAGDNEIYEKIASTSGGKIYKGKFGNRTVMGGFDIVYDCVGSSKTIHNALRWVKTRGTVVLVGSMLNIGLFDYTPIWNQEITLIGSEAHGMENYRGEQIPTFALAAQFIQEKKMQVEDLITHTFEPADYQKAIDRDPRCADASCLSGTCVSPRCSVRRRHP